MKSLRAFLTESDEHSEKRAKSEFNRMDGLTKTHGSFKGTIRRYYHHVGGELQRTLIGEHGLRSYNKGQSGHHFAMRYSARPGHEVHMHVKLPLNADLSHQDSIRDEIIKQNPHVAKAGHPTSLANDIVKYHGNDH